MRTAEKLTHGVLAGGGAAVFRRNARGALVSPGRRKGRIDLNVNGEEIQLTLDEAILMRDGLARLISQGGMFALNAAEQHQSEQARALLRLQKGTRR